MIYSLNIVNKSGGLIYYYECNKPPTDRQREKPLQLNECLTLASLFHGLNAVSIELSPLPECTGVQTLTADEFELHNYLTPTGTKFFILCEHEEKGIDTVLSTVYEIYCDYSLKNPFYNLDMPIRSEKFDFYIKKYFDSLAR